MARKRYTSRNRTHNGIRTRFLDQVSIAAFRPADAIGIDEANWLSLNNVAYGEASSQSGSGTVFDNDEIIDGVSSVVFRNFNIVPAPGALDDPGVNAFNVYINGLFIEKNAFVDSYPKNSGNDIELKINNQSASLENNFDQKDLIVITGKINAVG
tara:strand:- start:166 stop:630 length:465 start_codon:yes stop_codon:yes gene_type:complete